MLIPWVAYLGKWELAFRGNDVELLHAFSEQNGQLTHLEAATMFAFCPWPMIEFSIQLMRSSVFCRTKR